MPLVLKELGSRHATNRRNAAFCVGELCKNGGETALKYPFPCYKLQLYPRRKDFCPLVSMLIYRLPRSHATFVFP